MMDSGQPLHGKYPRLQDMDHILYPMSYPIMGRDSVASINHQTANHFHKSPVYQRTYPGVDCNLAPNSTANDMTNTMSMTTNTMTTNRPNMAMITMATHNTATHNMSTNSMSTNNMSTNNMSTNSMSINNMPTNNMPTNNMPTNNMPTNNMQTNNMPTNNMPTNNMSMNNMSMHNMTTSMGSESLRQTNQSQAPAITSYSLQPVIPSTPYQKPDKTNTVDTKGYSSKQSIPDQVKAILARYSRPTTSSYEEESADEDDIEYEPVRRKKIPDKVQDIVSRYTRPIAETYRKNKRAEQKQNKLKVAASRQKVAEKKLVTSKQAIPQHIRDMLHKYSIRRVSKKAGFTAENKNMAKYLLAKYNQVEKTMEKSQVDDSILGIGSRNAPSTRTIDVITLTDNEDTGSAGKSIHTITESSHESFRTSL